MGWIFIIVGLILFGIVMYLWLTVYNKKPQTPAERIEEIYHDKYSTEMNRFAAHKEAKVATARADLLGALNQETEQLAVKEQRIAEGKLANAQRQTEIQALEAHQILIAKALEKDWDTATYLEMEKLAETNRLTLEKEWRQAEQQLKAGFIYQLQAHQHLSLMTEYIGGLYDRAKRLEAEGKDREKNLIEEHIAFMEEDFRGRQRLLQTSEQKELQGSDENTDDSGDS
jgi:hypothetical protein